MMKSLLLSILVGLGVFAGLRLVFALAFTWIVNIDIGGPDLVRLLWTPSYIVALVAAILAGLYFNKRREKRPENA